MRCISRLSVEYFQVQVSFTVAGSPVDPTGDTVQMAFMRGEAVPGSGDWTGAEWESADGTYYAQILVGPGALVLSPGYWSSYVKVTDHPEIPVLPGPQLSIT